MFSDSRKALGAKLASATLYDSNSGLIAIAIYFSGFMMITLLNLVACVVYGWLAVFVGLAFMVIAIAASPLVLPHFLNGARRVTLFEHGVRISSRALRGSFLYSECDHATWTIAPMREVIIGGRSTTSALLEIEITINGKSFSFSAMEKDEVRQFQNLKRLVNGNSLFTERV